MIGMKRHNLSMIPVHQDEPGRFKGTPRLYASKAALKKALRKAVRNDIAWLKSEYKANGQDAHHVDKMFKDIADTFIEQLRKEQDSEAVLFGGYDDNERFREYHHGIATIMFIPTHEHQTLHNSPDGGTPAR